MCSKTVNILFIVLFVILTIFVFNSCTDLDDMTHSTIVSSQFEPDSEDIGALIGAAYIPWQSIHFRQGWELQEISADQLVLAVKPYGWDDGGVHKVIHQHRWDAETPRVVNTWQRLYSGVTNTNRVIYQIDSGSITLEGDMKNSYLAELRVLRAAYYYYLCDLYGNIPIITDFDIPEGYLPEQYSREEVYDFIVTEIEDSLPHLSEESNQSTYGRFNNKWAAYALLARMHLNAEIYTGTAQWEKAIEASDYIINSGQFSLDPQQRNVFAANNHESDEIIWSIPNDEVYGSSRFFISQLSMTQQNQFTFNTQYDGWGGLISIPQYIDTFEENDERYKQNWMKGQQFTSGGDSLFVQTGSLSGEPLIYVNEVPSVDSTQEIHSYRVNKWEIEAGTTAMNNDFPIFRYADILMTKAESLLRLGDPDGAAELVTEVRQRNFSDNPELATVTGDQLLEGSIYEYGITDVFLPNTIEGGDDIQYGRFLDELGWEFATEGRRRQDLIRFDVFTRKSWLSHSPNGDHRIIFPIPLEELENNSNLSQNPGY